MGCPSSRDFLTRARVNLGPCRVVQRTMCPQSTHTRAHTRAHTHTHVHTYTHRYTHTYTHVDMYVGTPTQPHTRSPTHQNVTDLRSSSSCPAPLLLVGGGTAGSLLEQALHAVIFQDVLESATHKIQLTRVRQCAFPSHHARSATYVRGLCS